MTEAVILAAINRVLSLWQKHQEGGEVTDEELAAVHRLAGEAEDDALDTP